MTYRLVTPKSARRPTVAVLALIAVLLLTTACEGDPAPSRTPHPSGWGPQPAEIDGMSVLAEADADGVRLHTASGDKTFLPGVNFSGSLPGREAMGDLAVSGDEYGHQLAEMGRMGIRVVRIYSLLPPTFYNALHYYNSTHPSAPIYLVQGLRTPDESFAAGSRTLYDPSVEAAFNAELLDASAAVHGDLRRPSEGDAEPLTWSADVSPWLVGWIVGSEWDPIAVARTDETEAEVPYEPGRYFAATSDATPTERWLARHLDALAEAESARGVSVPLSFVNWPTTDPLEHPQEPVDTEDLVGIDAEHVLPTANWPGGTFASFHAYPYYPDFLRHEPGLQEPLSDGRRDPYARYVRALNDHFTSMPVVIAEVGVPSSLGSAHAGPRDRDQGQHSEQEAMRIDADLLALVHDQGAAGAFITSWLDDWHRSSWNTRASKDAARAAYWQDPLTSEQWFGIIRHESQFLPGSKRVLSPRSGRLRRVVLQATTSYLHLVVRGRHRAPRRFALLVDAVPGGAWDYRVIVNRRAGRARASVRAELDPLRLYTDEDPALVESPRDWHLFRQLTNGSKVVDGRRRPVETAKIGKLVRGRWEVDAGESNSQATWRPDADSGTIRLRLPWSMVGMSDPSSHLALGAGEPPRGVEVDDLKLRMVADGSTYTRHYEWPTWESAELTERAAVGSGVLAAAYRRLAP